MDGDDEGSVGKRGDFERREGWILLFACSEGGKGSLCLYVHV